VKSSNARDILRICEVGGVLIGGASLRAADFDAVLGEVRNIATPAIARAAA
jgi:triosephosphate isomerase